MRALAMCSSLALLIGSISGQRTVGAEVPLDSSLESYQAVSGISGNLNSIGSDTLNNLMTFWAEEFRKIYPNVNIQIEGKGSATAPPALANGTAQLGPMSRTMKPEEEEAFEQKYGFRPTQVSVALDCLAVYVHRDNPIAGLSLEQVDAIFSSTRKGGHQDIATWGQLGLTGNWASRPLSLYGRNSASGTYAFFKEHALWKGDFKNTVKEQPGTAAVINGVANDRAGVGYGGIGYLTSEIRAVPLSKKSGESSVEPSFENALSGKYPLGRALYVYVAKKPGEPLSPLVREFLKFVLSQQGQEVVVKDGYGSLPSPVAARQLKVIER
jgi:phosphate transport system substrate-binding protein